MNNVRKVQIKIFVVPNPVMYWDGCSGDGPSGRPHTAYLMGEFVRIVERAEAFGFDMYDYDNKVGGPVTTSDGWVQVWCHDDNNDNLTNHGIPEDHPLFTKNRRRRAPGSIPLKFAKMIAEGGFTTIVDTDDGDIVEIEWVPSQEASRYRRYGTMAEAITYAEEKSSKYVNTDAKKAYEEYLKACESR